MNSDGWPPNGCAKCGQPERGHPGGDYAYVAPSNQLRLARMRARREARLNPPAPPRPLPDTVVTITANLHDLTETLRYVGDHARLFDESARALAARLRGPVAERARESRVIAISTPGTSTENIHRTRCRCSLLPFLDPNSHPVAGQASAELRDEDWPAQGSTCAHVCGPDPDHRCDARAVTTLRHTLPSGGTRDLPLCGPCNAAEADAPSVPN